MRRWIWFVLLLAAVVFYKVTWGLLLPFALALPIAFVLNPVVGWMTARTPLGRTAATILVFAFVALLGSGVILLATASLIQGVNSFVENLPQYEATLRHASNSVVSQLGNLLVKVPPDVVDVARNNVDQILQKGQQLLDQFGKATLAYLGALPGLASILLIGVLSAFFLTKDWDWFVAAFFRLLPPEWRESVDRTGSKVGSSLGRYVLAQGALVLLSTIFSVVGLAIIGADRWLAAGLVGGLLDMAPVIGPTLLYVPWAIYSFAVGRTSFGIALLVLFAIVSGVRQVFEAKVTGQSLGVHPLIMLASLYWGVRLLGAKGLILAPLTLIIVKAYTEAKGDAAR